MRPVTPNRTRWWLRVIAVSYAVALTYGLLAPAPLAFLGRTGRAAQEAIDWSLAGAAQHVVAYAGLTALWCWAQRRRSTWLRVGILCAAHGLVTEVLQLIVPNRYCDWQDMLGNLAGVLGGIGLAWLVRRWAPRRFRETREAVVAGSALG